MILPRFAVALFTFVLAASLSQAQDSGPKPGEWFQLFRKARLVVRRNHLGQPAAIPPPTHLQYLEIKRFIQSYQG